MFSVLPEGNSSYFVYHPMVRAGCRPFVFNKVKALFQSQNHR